MKNVFFILIFSPLFCALNAQEIGFRFGNMPGKNNIAIDGMYTLQDNTRVHADITFGKYLGAELVYNFVVKPIDELPNFYYYLGIGLSSVFRSNFEFGAVAEAGAEYHFPKLPLILGLDYRPAIMLVGQTDYYWNSFGLNLRYVMK